MSCRAILIGPMARPGAPLRSFLRRIGVRKGEMLIAVDRGAELALKSGLRPDLAVGDWDSLRDRSVLSDVPHLTLPRDKDESDLFFAAMAAVSAGATELLATGVSGGRPDHQLGVLLDLSRLAGGALGPLDSVTLQEEEAEYHFLSMLIPEWRAKVRPGQLVSLFALGGPVRGLTLDGFEYGMKRAVLEPGTRGLSNRATRSRCAIRLCTGNLVAILPVVP